MTNKTILVSGASGFLGKEIIRQLLKSKNYKIIALTSKPNDLMNYFNNPSRLIAFNISDWTSKIEKNIKMDFLVNCAFPRTSNSMELAKGLDFTKQLIINAIDFNIKNIINISSQSVYSQKSKSLPNETSPVAPESLYGMAKYATEKIVTVLCERSASKINFTNIRLASLTGVELEARMTNKFVKRALDGGKITVNGRGQKVSYLDVRDAASALLAMIDSNSRKWKPIYNLGNHNYSSVLEIAETVKKVAEEYSFNEVIIEVKAGQDNFNNLIDSELFYKDFYWKPYYTIPLMIKDLFEYYTANV